MTENLRRRHPAYDPETGDRWEYTVPEGAPVDIEVLNVTPGGVDFRYGTTHYAWGRRSFADACKNWRLVSRAPGGNP